MMHASSLIEYLSRDADPPCDQAAIRDMTGGDWTRAQLLQQVSLMARGLSALGMRPGDRVLYCVRPSRRAVTLMMAIAEAGGVLIPLDSTMGPDLFRTRMDQLAPRWVAAESLLWFLATSPWTHGLLSRRGISLPPIAGLSGVRRIRTGMAWPGAWNALSQSAIAHAGLIAEDCPCGQHDGDDPVMIVFTSGTTSNPKAVVHSWRSMHGVLDAVAGLLDAGAGDVVLASELHLILPALAAGSRVVVPRSGRPGPARMLNDLRKQAVSHWFTATSEIQALLDHVRAGGGRWPRTLREIWIGGAPAHRAFLDQLMKTLPQNTRVYCVYGLTEMLPVARVSAAEKLQHFGQGDLVGDCVPGVTARLSRRGELLLRGPNLAQGYLDQPRIEELATGDLAQLDGRRIVLLGRNKDMIIRGHFNLYPALYEPGIAATRGVHRCALVGIYDERLADERVVLAVEPSQGVDSGELEERLWCQWRTGRLDPRARPDAIVTMALPVTGRSRKIDKKALRGKLTRTLRCTWS